MLSYDIFWKTLKEKGVSQYTLIEQHGVSPSQLTRIKRNQGISTNTLAKFCKILNCDISDIVQYIPDEDEPQNGDAQE